MVTRYMNISCFSVCDARKGPEFHSSPSLFDIEEEEMEHFLGCHSEKLAIAFGLITTPKDVIRVVKNLCL